MNIFKVGIFLFIILAFAAGIKRVENLEKIEVQFLIDCELDGGVVIRSSYLNSEYFYCVDKEAILAIHVEE